MSRFIYFQDMHCKGVNSRNRLGNYFEDCLLKLDEILSIAKNNKVDGILDGGDLFDGATPSYNVIDAVADKVEKTQINFYSLLGNHNMLYAHRENSQGSGLYHLQKRCKYFHYLNRIEGESFIIEGLDYKFGIENELKNKSWTITCNPDIHKDDPIWRIGVLHALVTPNKFFDKVAYLECKDIQTNANLVLLAHYHHPFKKVIGDTTFLNIGCAGRDNINEAKIDPSILLIDTDNQSYEIIKLKSTKFATEIFDLSKYQEIKENEKSIEDFIASLNSATWQACDLRTQIQTIGKEQNVEKKVINYGLNILDKIKIGE